MTFIPLVGIGGACDAESISRGTKVNEHAKNLRRTRADMLGTDDEEHYWECHRAAAYIEQLEAVAKAAQDVEDNVAHPTDYQEGFFMNALYNALTALENKDES